MARSLVDKADYIAEEMEVVVCRWQGKTIDVQVRHAHLTPHTHAPHTHLTHTSHTSHTPHTHTHTHAATVAKPAAQPHAATCTRAATLLPLLTKCPRRPSSRASVEVCICLQVPKTVVVKVAETEPGAKGNTAGGRVEKTAKLETGATINVPIFIDIGEEIKVDTEEGKYLGRVGASVFGNK